MKYKKLYRCGNLIIVSAPSGAGKSTLVQYVLQHVPDVAFSISYTTRPPRENEENGRDYFFVSVNEFQRMRERELFVECAQVHGNWYGTAQNIIENHLNCGCDVILDIDVQGAAQVCQKFPSVITVFLMPPSLGELKQRLSARKTDSTNAVERRLGRALKELEEYHNFEYVIINDNCEMACQALVSIILAGRYRRELQSPFIEPVIKTFKEK